MSKIKVNSIEAATGTTITIPSGQTLDISSTTLTLPSTVVTTTGTQTLTNKTIGATQLTGTIPTTIGGTGLTTIGTSLQVLRVNSGATALEYAAVAAGGKVLQVITATDSTFRSTTSTSFVTASNTLSVTITPSSVSSRIFVVASTSIINTSGDGLMYGTIYRDSTNLASTYGMYGGESVSGITSMRHPMCLTILDSPATTSAITYQVYFRSQSGSYTAGINGRSDEPTKGSITAFEIGA
jgi:hypothetical protein